MLVFCLWTTCVDGICGKGEQLWTSIKKKKKNRADSEKPLPT